MSTPIGNLEDLTARAARVLGEVDAVLAEDTRRTRRLIDHLGLSTPLVSLYSQNEVARLPEVLARLEAGERLALVSDAGTPLVSDPGGRLVHEVLGEGHEVVPLPGASAVLAAIVASGFPAIPFSFLGFVPRKGRDRAECLDRVADALETTVLFESPDRTAALLEELAEKCAVDRLGVVAREITKVHEEFRRGTLLELARYYRTEGPPRGEVTLVVSPGERTDSAEVDETAGRALAAALLAEGASASRAARELSARLGISRNQAYELVHDVRDNP